MFVCSYRRFQVVNVLPKKKKRKFRRVGGDAFWISESKEGGIKTWKPSVVGYGYFLELRIVTFVT